jgi:hypothetical protein
MARTRGAKDNKPRKKAAPRPQQIRPTSTSQLATPTPEPPSGPVRPALDGSDFKAAIAAELNKASGPAESVPSNPGQGDSSPSGPVPDSPAIDPSALTLEGLSNALRLPFYALARVLKYFRIAPDPEPIEAVGRRRAKELAKAVNPIWDYYARQYVNQHPDQGVNVALGVTALDAIGIVPDLIDAVVESRARAAKAAAAVVTPKPAT